MRDPYKMAGLLIFILGLIASGFYVANPTGYGFLTGCREAEEPYIALEPYKVRDTYIQWGEIYLEVFSRNNITIPTDEPVFISFTLCEICKYNITFASDKPTNYFLFDEFNKEMFEEKEPAFSIFSRWEKTNETFSFEPEREGVYYFVFDRSFQKTKTAESQANGVLIIKELKGFRRTIEEIEYKEVTKYRTVIKCD